MKLPCLLFSFQILRPSPSTPKKMNFFFHFSICHLSADHLFSHSRQHPFLHLNRIYPQVSRIGFFFSFSPSLSRSRKRELYLHPLRKSNFLDNPSGKSNNFLFSVIKFTHQNFSIWKENNFLTFLFFLIFLFLRLL